MVEERRGTLGSFEDEEEGKKVEGKLTEEVGHGGIAGHFFFSFLLISKIRNNEEGELLR